jgi:outer membrane usher protein
VGSGAFLGGIGVSRVFSLDPYLFRDPSLGFARALPTPSTVDIYVNGILLRRVQLPPGLVELRNLAVYSGSGFTQVVIRDAFGRGITGSAFHRRSGDQSSTAIQV